MSSRYDIEGDFRVSDGQAHGLWGVPTNTKISDVEIIITNNDDATIQIVIEQPVGVQAVTQSVDPNSQRAFTSDVRNLKVQQVPGTEAPIAGSFHSIFRKAGTVEIEVQTLALVTITPEA